MRLLIEHRYTLVVIALKRVRKIEHKFKACRGIEARTCLCELNAQQNKRKTTTAAVLFWFPDFTFRISVYVFNSSQTVPVDFEKLKEIWNGRNSGNIEFLYYAERCLPFSLFSTV